MRGLNTTSFKVTQSVDKAVTGPVARGYKKTIPSPVRSGLRNALRNLGEPVVAVNYLLQLKPAKSLETLGRLAINSTAGVAGLFDVAKKRPFNLPYRMNGFAYTLGYYGVKPGPLYVPSPDRPDDRPRPGGAPRRRFAIACRSGQAFQ
jgi:phospholipid-binding lipoprotein MlaA